MADGKPSVAAVKKFFAPDQAAGEFLKEWKALTDQDKADLAGGIDNGTMTY